MTYTSKIPIDQRSFPSSDDQRSYNVHITKDIGNYVDGYQVYNVQGDYEDLMDFLTGYFKMTDSEADISIEDNEQDMLSARTHSSGRQFENLSLKELYDNKDVHEHKLSEAPATSTPATCFDKFMDRIVLQESSVPRHLMYEDSPQRKRAARHQDRPNNKTRFR